MKLLPLLPPPVILTKEYFHPLPLPIRRRRPESDKDIFLTQLRIVGVVFLLVLTILLTLAACGVAGAALVWFNFTPAP